MLRSPGGGLRSGSIRPDGRQRRLATRRSGHKPPAISGVRDAAPLAGRVGPRPGHPISRKAPGKPWLSPKRRAWRFHFWWRGFPPCGCEPGRRTASALPGSRVKKTKKAARRLPEVIPKSVFADIISGTIRSGHHLYLQFFRTQSWQRI